MAPSPNHSPHDELDVDLTRGDASAQAIAMLEKHKNVVMLTALLAALAICGVLVFKELAKQRRIEAAEAYSEAVADRSPEKLDAVVANHEGTVAAGNALLMKADLQLKMEKREDAKSTLLAFLEKHPRHPGHTQALFSLGNIALQANQPAEANEYYDRALMKDPGGHLALLLHIRKGDLLLTEADALLADGKHEESEKKKAEARNHYEAFIKEPQLRASPFIGIAEERIGFLALGNPPVVPPPPKPEKDAEKKPGEAGKKPAETQLEKPAPAKPAPSDPSAKPAAPTKPAELQPQPAKPAPAKPAPSDPSAKPAAPTKPAEPQPQPEKPAPSDGGGE